MNSIGREYVVVFSNMEFDNIVLTEAIESAISYSHLHTISSGEHLFEGGGVTKFWILTESHVALSTWPEKHSGIINVFVCNESFNLQDFIEGFKSVLPNAYISFAERTFET